MAINLNKYRVDLLEAWNDVLNTKTQTDWALFGYEGQSNDLKLVSKGENGIEELTEDLNSGKIMYAFVKVMDPKTSLPKCVLINWQGEGANTVRKGICANHLRDVEKFFHGANVTINARNEEEVEPQLVLDKVAKAGSAYSFKGPRGDDSAPVSKPIGSNYKRVNPVQEINATERDQFWMKEELEEKKRIEEEQRRKDMERKRQEEEAMRRETLEAEKREEKTKLRDSGIDQIKQAVMHAAESTDKCIVADGGSDCEINKYELLRQARNEEAQNVIAQRTIDARSIFEKNTSAGQIKRTPEKPIRTSILRAQQAQQQRDETNISTEYTK